MLYDVIIYLFLSNNTYLLGDHLRLLRIGGKINTKHYLDLASFLPYKIYDP